MSKDSIAKEMPPSAVVRSLQQLGENILIARKRRKESLAEFSQRIQVSIPTLRKIEMGDPSVSMAGYATAIWALGQINALGKMAQPESDEAALRQEISAISRPRMR